MDLAFSEEQLMLREMVRGLLSEMCPVDVVRAMEDDPTGYPPTRGSSWPRSGSSAC